MSGAIPILTYLQISYLRTYLIYVRTKSPQKGLFLFHKAWNMTNNCVSVTKTLMMGVKLMTELQKNTHKKSKVQFRDNISVSKRIHIFSCTTMIAKHFTQTFILTCCRLTLILSVLQHYAYHQISNFEIYTSLTTMLQRNASLFLT